MLRRVALVLAVLGLLAGVSATGGFSAVSADRGLSVTVAPDDRAYFGVDLVADDADDRPAISFVGFCTDGTRTADASARVTRYKIGVDRANATEEALAVAWETETPVSTVVLKTGGGATALATFPGGQSGTATVGDGAETTNLTPSDYCPDGEHEAGKVEAAALDVAPDATAVGGVRVTVVNRFPVSLETVTVTAGGTTRTVEDLMPGESATVAVPDCERVAIEGTGEDVAVDLRRDCPQDRADGG